MCRHQRRSTALHRSVLAVRPAAAGESFVYRESGSVILLGCPSFGGQRTIRVAQEGNSNLVGSANGFSAAIQARPTKQ